MDDLCSFDENLTYDYLVGLSISKYCPFQGERVMHLRKSETVGKGK